jgi:hypothetical protein
VINMYSWDPPSDAELLWLLDQGVSDKTLWPISGATVRFDDATFDLDHEGERALVFRADDCGEVIDLIAWQPRNGKLASWRGRLFVSVTWTTYLTPPFTLVVMLYASTRRRLIGCWPTGKAS